MDNEAAQQLWAQLFSRMASEERATIYDPEHDIDKDYAKLSLGLAQAGWSPPEIKARIEAHKSDWVNSPVTSPGVAPHVEIQFSKLCDSVEAAMDRLNLASHDRIVRGIEPRTGPHAAMTNVIMTTEGIITVGSFLFRFCGLIARAFTRTLYLNPWLWENPTCSDASACALLRRSPVLLAYWLRIYMSFAITGTHLVVPYRPANKHEVLLFEQIARAMEIFAIAHEYGHHHHGHGRQLQEDPKREEFQADQFALRISYEVESQPILFANPYLSSGAGGTVLLLALDTLRRFEERISGVSLPLSKTHPTIEERLARFDSVSVLKPEEFVALKGFRGAAKRIMAAVDAEMSQLLRLLPVDTLDELRTSLLRQPR
jgi:hypothetical protein